MTNSDDIKRMLQKYIEERDYSKREPFRKALIEFGTEALNYFYEIYQTNPEDKIKQSIIILSTKIQSDKISEFFYKILLLERNSENTRLIIDWIVRLKNVTEKLNNLKDSKIEILVSEYFQKISVESLVEQVEIAQKILFTINNTSNLIIIEDFLKKHKPQKGNLVQEVLIDVLQKNISLTAEQKKKAEKFYSRNSEILEDLINNYDYKDEKYNLSEIAKKFEREFSEQTKLETVEVIKLLKQEFGAFIIYRYEWNEIIFETIYNLIIKSRNITVLLIPNFIWMLNDANSVDGLSYDCDKAETALNAIGAIKHEAIIPFLADYLFLGERIYSDWEAYYDDAVCVRANAARLLGNYKSKKAVKLLLRSLDESAGSVVLNAINSLGEIGDKEVIPAIYRFLPGIFRVRIGYPERDEPYQEYIYKYNEECQKITNNTLQKFGVKPDMNIGVKLLLRRSFLLLIDLSENRGVDFDRFFELGETNLLSQTLDKYPAIFREELINLKNELIKESKIDEEIFSEIIEGLKNYWVSIYD